MNEHVTGIGPTLANKLPTLKELFTKFLDKNKSPATSFFFCNISPNEVKLEILYMSNNKSYGFHSCPVSIPNPVTFLFFFFEGFPTVASCHWHESRKNNRKLGKLYMVFKSSNCCLHFTSVFD